MAFGEMWIELAKLRAEDLRDEGCRSRRYLDLDLGQARGRRRPGRLPACGGIGVTVLQTVVINAADPPALAVFWAGLLDVKVVESSEDWAQLDGTLAFQRDRSRRPGRTGCTST